MKIKKNKIIRNIADGEESEIIPEFRKSKEKIETKEPLKCLKILKIQKRILKYRLF